MRLDPWVRTGGDFTGPFRPVGILFQVTRHVTKSLGLSGHLGNLGLSFWLAGINERHPGAIKLNGLCSGNFTMAASKQKDLLLALELITAPELPRIARSFAAEALKMQEKAKPWAMGKGIQGIGIAEKITDGQKLGVLAIKVYVKKKLPKSKLEDVVPKNLTVPGVEEKIETDIQEIGIVTEEPNTIRVRPAIPGFGVGHVNITVGTFGCLVRKKDDDQTLYILNETTRG